MIACHLISSEFALKVLRDRCLKIANINELNDLFEFCAADFSDADIRIKLEAFKNQVGKRYSVICFCEDYRDDNSSAVS